MKLKILQPWERTDHISYRMVFDLDQSLDFEWLETPGYKDPVDILILNHLNPPSNYVNYNYRSMLFLDVYHNSEDQIKALQDRTHGGKIYVTNAIDFDISHPLIVFNDFLFNRTKAYYLKYPFPPATYKWYFTTQEDYQIPNHNVDEKTKIFLAPNVLKDHAGREMFGRTNIVNLLKDMMHLGHVGCRDKNLNLYSKSEVPDFVNTISKLLLVKHGPIVSSGYVPPHNLYYQDTFISIYGETIEFGSSFAATEKTFDPLIKGHFILPFSNQHFVRNLQRQYGFKFPDFIDYSYDDIADIKLRSAAHINEVRRLLSLDLDVWKQHWVDNQSILDYNKSVFYTKPYHTIDYTKFLN